MLIGYTRVSTQQEDANLQRASLVEAGCHQLFEDYGAANCVTLPAFCQLQTSLKKGDTVVIYQLDRLGCGIKKLETLLMEFRARGVHFRSLLDGIDTRTGKGRAFFESITGLANMERGLALERSIAGREVAKKTGRTGGRRRQMTDSKILRAQKLLASGMPPRDAATILGVSVPTLYRWIPAPTRTIQRATNQA